MAIPISNGVDADDLSQAVPGAELAAVNAELGMVASVNAILLDYQTTIQRDSLASDRGSIPCER